MSDPWLWCAMVQEEDYSRRDDDDAQEAAPPFALDSLKDVRESLLSWRSLFSQTCSKKIQNLMCVYIYIYIYVYIYICVCIYCGQTVSELVYLVVIGIWKVKFYVMPWTSVSPALYAQFKLSLRIHKISGDWHNRYMQRQMNGAHSVTRRIYAVLGASRMYIPSV